jgi:hypothetical protein
MIEKGLVEKDGEDYYKVDGETVRKIKQQGRTRLSCSCENCTRFCNEEVLCSRKIAVILFEAQDFKLKKKIREGLEDIERSEKLGIDLEKDYFKCLLNDLRSYV